MLPLVSEPVQQVWTYILLPTHRTTAALIAFTTFACRTHAAEADLPVNGDGGGGLLLLLLLAWLLFGGRKDEYVRCPRCKFRSPRRTFVNSCCPNCGSYEPSVR